MSCRWSVTPGMTCESGALPLEPSHIGDLQKADTSSQGALVFLSKDYEIENQNPLASPTNTLLGSAKEQTYQRGLERNDSWGSFDLRAAIVYHTKGNSFVYYTKICIGHFKNHIGQFNIYLQLL